jgi:hypothetical protein
MLHKINICVIDSAACRFPARLAPWTNISELMLRHITHNNDNNTTTKYKYENEQICNYNKAL